MQALLHQNQVMLHSYKLKYKYVFQYTSANYS